MTFIEKLKRIQRANNSLLCVGLDSEIGKLPLSLQGLPDMQYEFNRRIIEKTSRFVCAYKLNLAFYEAAGQSGYETIRRTLDCIPDGIVTIADGKRGDIGNTAEQYAKAIFTDLKFDASTVNPYMGKDSVEPFSRSEEKGVFVLALTSNPGSADFQNLDILGRPLYEHVVARVMKWNDKKNLGIVAGATHAVQLKRIRSMAHGLPILIPGIGAQKGDLESAVRYGCDTGGGLALFNSSRGIIFASGGDGFAEKAEEEAGKMRESINLIREKYFKS